MEVTDTATLNHGTTLHRQPVKQSINGCSKYEQVLHRWGNLSFDLFPSRYGIHCQLRSRSTAAALLQTLQPLRRQDYLSCFFSVHISILHIPQMELHGYGNSQPRHDHSIASQTRSSFAGRFQTQSALRFCDSLRREAIRGQKQHEGGALQFLPVQG